MPHHQSRSSRLRDRRGSIVTLSAILLIVMLGMLAFAVDIGYVAAERTTLQSAADACALAAIREFPEQVNVDNLASQYAALNHPISAGSLDVITVAGTWNKDTLSFAPTGNLATANALQVTVSRMGTPLFFASVIGNSNVDVSASAVAMMENGDCFDKGILAGDRVIMGQDIRLNNYCVYGRNGVSMGQDPHVTNGAKVGALAASTIEYGQDPVGLPENIIEADKQPELANNIMQVINDLMNGGNMPPQITNVEYFPSATHLPNELFPGTAYIFEESISINQDYLVADVIIATKKNISWGQDGAINNTGSTDGSSYAIGLYAGESISLGQDAIANGVNIVGGKDVTIGQDIRAFSGTIQSAQKVILGQDPHLTGAWLDAISQAGSQKPILVK